MFVLKCLLKHKSHLYFKHFDVMQFLASRFALNQGINEQAYCRMSIILTRSKGKSATKNRVLNYIFLAKGGISMYRFNSFTQKANEVLNLAIKSAENYGHSYVGSEHILVGLLKEGTGLGAIALMERGITLEDVDTLIVKKIGIGHPTRLSPNDFTPRSKRIVELSFQIARSMMNSFVGTEHLLISLTRETDSFAVRFINELGADESKITDNVSRYISTNDLDTKQNQKQSKKAKSKTPVLDEFGIDLTEIARQGKIDPVIGRDNEVKRVIQILSRRNKNNPCLIGEPGVGKTAIAEGLALKIVRDEASELLKNKRIISLDLTLMVAGTKYRGDFEDRIKKVMNEVKDSTDIILFIDEVHNIMGAGAAEGAVDAANILKPSLARGDIQIIGATTLDEYRKNIEKDSALERRFQPVNVDEPTEQETIEILMGIRDKYEAHHKVKITDDAIKSAVKLSTRYIADRFLPDKAIDLIDEAASIVRLDKSYHRVNSVTHTEIESVVSEWTGIPVSQLTREESEQLLEMESILHQSIIGQDEAVSSISRAIRRSRVGLKSADRPICSFLFLGPTGVGKTALCKALSKAMFGSEDAIIKLDMSEYMEKHTVSKLIGPPPGYVGFDDGGYLTEKVRRKPYSIVLFDEIEKAHKDVHNLLLQIMEDGILTDSQGRKVSFKNAIIIMTSNIGASKITSKSKNLGFGDEKEISIKDQIMPEIKSTFKPEFINRLDDIIVFNKLNRDDLKKIAHIMINGLQNRAKDINIDLFITQATIDRIVELGYDEKYGARPLRKVIQANIEDKLSELILVKTITPNEKCIVDYRDNEFVFS